MTESAIWTEKYRPKTFEQVKGQQHVINKVKAFVEQNNMPHLLFAGPAGIGKSTIALVMARQLFGESWRQNFLELNASDERGIDIIRVKVKDFARTKALGDVPFKIILLDEADALTKEAQQALRRTMENYTSTCRFILSCNYMSKILDPIQSRCAIFKFKPLPKENIFELIDQIANNESLELSDETKLALFKASNGDCRKLENIMQSCAAISKNITTDIIFSMASMAQPQEIKQILELALKNKFIESRNMLLDTMLNYGLSGLDVIKQISREVWKLDKEHISDRGKVMILDKTGDIEFRLVEGSDEFLQLEALLAYLTLLGEKESKV